MKITFDDGGYLEFQRSKKPYHVHVIVAAKDSSNTLKLLVNSAEIQLNQLIEAVKSVSGPIILEGESNDKAQNQSNNSNNDSGNTEAQSNQ